MDVKRLRLTSRELAETVNLCIDRVYISPNRANLDCLNNILNHDRYRLRVQEIVWDDAQLDDYPTFEGFQERLKSDKEKARVALEDHLYTLFQGNDDHKVDYDSIGVSSCIDEDGNLTQFGKVILLSSGYQKSGDIVANHAASMGAEDSYDLYQKLHQDEKEIIKRGWDIAGLQRALTQLPNLRRITLTSEVWRPWSPVPTYDTPFYRALPAGFQKPSVWPWIGSDRLGSVIMPMQDTSTEHLPTKWRGYSIIMAALVANPVRGLQEFILDTGQESIGLPHQFFTLPNVDFTNTVQVLSIAPIRKFQFSFSEHIACTKDLNVRASVDLDLLRLVIGAMPLLEHLDLQWRVLAEQARDPLPDGFLQKNCPGLRHLALRYAKVTGSWLYNLIVDLKNLETVALDKIDLAIREPDVGMSCEEFFSRLRNHYAKSCCRGPRLTWIDYLPEDPTQDRLFHTSKQWVVVDHELDAFLYDGGESPWIHGYSRGQVQALHDTVGWVMDGRDSSFRKRMSEMFAGTFTRHRNPWPIDGAMMNTPMDWRIY